MHKCLNEEIHIIISVMENQLNNSCADATAPKHTSVFGGEHYDKWLPAKGVLSSFLRAIIIGVAFYHRYQRLSVEEIYRITTFSFAASVYFIFKTVQLLLWSNLLNGYLTNLREVL